MYKLVLNVGDSVRNIKKASSLYLFRGIVTFVGENLYHVEYSNGDKQYYHKKTAHNFLEKTVESLNDKVCNAYISIAKSVTGGTRTIFKKEGRTIYVNDNGIGWDKGAALSNDGGHDHWVGIKVEVAISYV